MTEAAARITKRIFRHEGTGNYIAIFLISLLLVTSAFFLQGRIDISLQDEGFLWYGASRTLIGEVPFRDFQSYDPGRYYWVALWLKFLGNGLISYRISLAAMQVLGLFCGLMTAARVVSSRFFLTLTGIALLLWMYPRHKVFEHSIAMALVYAGTMLIERPTMRRLFLSGVLVGIAGFFGRNHGLYAAIGFSGLVLFLHYKCRDGQHWTKFTIFSGGLLLGYLPMIGMLAGVNGFAAAFRDSILFLMDLGGTNISLPVPWPWRLNFVQPSFTELVYQVLVGSIFLLMPLFFVGGLIFAFWIPKEQVRTAAVLIAVCFVGVPYMHHVFSRADINHLAQGIHPFLLGVVALPQVIAPVQVRVKASVVCVVLAITLYSIGLVSPLYKMLSNPQSFVKYDIGGDTLLIKKETASILTAVEHVNDNLVMEGEQLLIAPHWPMLYQILNRKCPVWESYNLHKRRPDVQIEMIRQLQQQKANWVILGDVPLDGRDDLRFRNTHRLLWQYITNEYAVYPIGGLPTNYALWKKK